MAPKHSRIPLPLLLHPFEIVLGLAQAISGVAGLCGFTSPSLRDLPHVIVLIYSGVAASGGFAIVVGLWHRNEVDAMRGSGRAVERAALFLVASGYGGLASAILLVNFHRGAISGLIYVLIALACLLRAYAIRQTSRVIVDQLSKGRNE